MVSQQTSASRNPRRGDLSPPGRTYGPVTYRPVGFTVRNSDYLPKPTFLRLQYHTTRIRHTAVPIHPSQVVALVTNMPHTGQGDQATAQCPYRTLPGNRDAPACIGPYPPADDAPTVRVYNVLHSQKKLCHRFPLNGDDDDRYWQFGVEHPAVRARPFTPHVESEIALRCDSASFNAQNHVWHCCSLRIAKTPGRRIAAGGIDDGLFAHYM